MQVVKKTSWPLLRALYEGEVKEEDTVTSSIEVMEDVEQLRDMASEAPVIRLVNSVLTKAIEVGASDIHLEVFERNARLRYRVDGVLRELTPPPREIYNAIVSRIKILAKMNIAEEAAAPGRPNQDEGGGQRGGFEGLHYPDEPRRRSGDEDFG